MSFQEEMAQMQPTDVERVVRDRLLQGKGVPWNNSQGEPRWALLHSSFLVWKQKPDQLAAFQAAATNLLIESVSKENWSTVSDVAELEVALATDAVPWRDFDFNQLRIADLLSTPCESDARLRASIALLHFANVFDQIDLAWCRGQFHATVPRLFNERTNPACEIQWLMAIWKTLVSVGVHSAESFPWFDLFRSISSVSNSRQRERLFDLALAHARPAMTSARMQSAIEAFTQTQSIEDKYLLIELMHENWTTTVNNCEMALSVAKRRIAQRVDTVSASTQRHVLSLRSPESSGKNRWSNLCPAE